MPTKIRKDRKAPAKKGPPAKKPVAAPRKRKASATSKKPTPKNQQKSTRKPGRKDQFPIVGIGASAGGLEAFESFFTNLPPDSGMAFVLVQHLDPTHKSILVDLVQRYTRMQVEEAKDGMLVEPDRAYIIPPNRDMAILNRCLHLIEPIAPRGHRLPIDYFFRSLAQDQQQHAVAIILSGTGTDGTLGSKTVKGEGGMVMVQSPDSAKYDGMPRSALNAGVADYVLPAEEMANQLIAYVELASGKLVLSKADPIPVTEDDVKKIYILIRNQTGHDFSLYKSNTVMRRIERRMTVNQIAEMEQYLRYLQQNPMEVETLFKELLIGVTSFFRDTDAFHALKTIVIPSLFQDRPKDRPIRVWVPGCSSGEEAYSIAILLHEFMQQNQLDFDIQVFATDIDAEAIESARLGLYPDSIALDVPPDLLKRYFSRKENSYLVEQTLRESMVFATHSIIKDPPFSKLDLVTCRNLLIYMGSELQKRVLPLFHYALNPSGYLFLGHSESLGDAANLFRTTDQKWKIFQSIVGVTPVMPRVSFQPQQSNPDVDFSRQDVTDRSSRRLSYRDLTERMLLRDHAPAAVLVDEHNDILFINGSTGDYLEPARGEANLNLLSMARPNMRLDITTALRKARNTQKDVRIEGLRLSEGKSNQLLDITVRGISNPAAYSGLMLVMFEQHDAEESKAKRKQAMTVDSGSNERIGELEQELEATQDHLQTTIEELETSNEELTSTNEEMQSSNEELQSTNEELETSKEELQSVNEELMTVNTELETKVQELSTTNNDMNNLLSATEIGTLFLDMDLNIKRYTPSLTGLIKLIQTDLGRPLSDIAYNLGGVDLCEKATKVLDELTPFEQEVDVRGEAYYLLRILPYRTARHSIDGIVITFVDITAQRRAEYVFRQCVKYSLIATIISDSEGRMAMVNEQAVNLFGWAESELIGQPVEKVLPEDLREQHRQYRAKYMESPTQRTLGEQEPVRCISRDGDEFKAVIGLTPLEPGKKTSVMVNILKV